MNNNLVMKVNVHYISSNQTHIVRKKDVLSFRYKDYDLYILKFFILNDFVTKI